MPFQSPEQMRAMFAKGGKSAQAARRWLRVYGPPKGGLRGAVHEHEQKDRRRR